MKDRERRESWKMENGRNSERQREGGKRVRREGEKWNKRRAKDRGKKKAEM